MSEIKHKVGKQIVALFEAEVAFFACRSPCARHNSLDLYYVSAEKRTWQTVYCGDSTRYDERSRVLYEHKPAHSETLQKN
mmetsp:Transcript_18803/g.47046  ORF Transcript_18803/g.47046 Transcript_18803/m.47046 type:complete len:80 (-) Transcript_18803:501-740(-)